jgi:hypothetical protein
MYSARNGTTKLPNLFRKVPKKRIHTTGGRARKLVERDGVGFMEAKNPARLPASRVKISCLD